MTEGNPRQATLARVLAPENLSAAWLAVKANKGSAGVDRMDIKESAQHFQKHKEAILAKLHQGTYKPGAVKAVEIPKANGGKRQLGIPNVTDRVIQQAIHQVLSPVWEPEFSDHSYGFRPKRSAHDAVKAAAQFVKEGKSWVIDLDLKDYFNQIDHDKLMHQLRQKIADKALRSLIGAYLRAPLQDKQGKKTKRWQGTPQGGPLSPLLANIYLDPLDKELEKRGLSFVRYADDIAIFASSQRSAERIYERIVSWIEKTLKLEVNRDKSGVGPTGKSEGLLGFRICDDGEIRVSPKSLRRLKSRVRELWDGQQNATSKQLRDQWSRYINGWWNYFKLAETGRKKANEVVWLSGWIRRHMRKCFWLRWKTPRGRINALRRLGVNQRGLGNGYSSRGAWPMSLHVVVQRALNNKTLRRYGFTMPWEAENQRQVGGR